MSKINTFFPPWCLGLVAVEIVWFKPILVPLVLFSHDEDNDDNVINVINVINDDNVLLEPILVLLILVLVSHDDDDDAKDEDHDDHGTWFCR